MYDPKNPSLTISEAADINGKIIGLVFSPRKRQLTDGMDIDELEDRAAEKRALQKAAVAHYGREADKSYSRPEPIHGEMPPGWFGEKDR